MTTEYESKALTAYRAFVAEYHHNPYYVIATIQATVLLEPTASEDEICIQVKLTGEIPADQPQLPVEYKGFKVFTKIVFEPDPYAEESCCGEGCTNCCS